MTDLLLTLLMYQRANQRDYTESKVDDIISSQTATTAKRSVSTEIWKRIHLTLQLNHGV